MWYLWKQVDVQEVDAPVSLLHTSLFSFELIMLSVLGVSLPVVYWRKIRVHYL